MRSTSAWPAGADFVAQALPAFGRGDRDWPGTRTVLDAVARTLGCG